MRQLLELLRALGQLIGFDHAPTCRTVGEGFRLEQGAVESEQRRRALDDELLERAQHPAARMLAVDVVDDELRDERVVEIGDLVSRPHARVDAHADATRLPIGRDPPRRRQEAACDVLGVDAALNGVPTQDDVILAKG